MRARDTMSSPVRTVPQTSTVESATAKSVTALPVVDAAGVLVGMVSESDLLWHRVPAGPSAGPVLAGILTSRSAEDVLRCAFAEALRRDVALHVLAVGPSPTADEEVLVRELVDVWAEKYPAIPVTFARRHDIDAAITLTGASRHCGLVVVAEPADGHDVAVVQDLSRRAHCPFMVAVPVR